MTAGSGERYELRQFTNFTCSDAVLMTVPAVCHTAPVCLVPVLNLPHFCVWTCKCLRELAAKLLECCDLNFDVARVCWVSMHVSR